MAKPKAKAAPDTIYEPEIVGSPATEEQQLVSSNTDALTGFLGGMQRFFRESCALEAKAQDRLTEAKKFEGDLKLAGALIPRDADEDAKAQVMIRAAKMGRTATDTFWSITGVMSKLHKATVAGRERAGKLDDEAAAIAQRLHNGYTDAEKARIRELEAENRRVEEQRARDERAREVQALEEAAVRAEADSPALSEREQRFVGGMVAGDSGPEACARTAGYKDPAQIVVRLLANPKILAAIEASRAAENIRQQAAAKQAMPLDVQVEKVQPNIQRTGGGHDRVTWSADVFDAAAFMAALLDPRERMKFGIPADCATFDQVKLNEVARAMHEKMNVFPGVRAKKNTSTV